ncbi:MAG: hypothetical protein JST22_00480 [Bacteroidetes bacterium]|nr:hypothetical protein [Bacteroidota bacterium]
MSSLPRTLSLVAAVLGLAAPALRAQALQNPILFVTQVPSPNDSANVASLFANHVADMPGAPRGGDLWIRYPDGTLKNLTQTAGYGVSGLQAQGAIAVREPSVHWSGTKAIFSMVVGGASSQGDATPFYWQLYEITGLGKNETPVITKVPNQPSNFNNVSPIYGTDDRIIFTSDRTISGDRSLYPAMDEYKGAPTNTGAWSLDPVTGDLFQLDHSPSGDFSPTIDSYGRLLLMRWDRLQRDRNADIDALGTGVKGTFNYTDESLQGVPQYNVRPETFPEPQGSRTDLLNGTNMVGMEFNQFFPWQINEDGTSPEIINHLGRHEMRQVFNRSITDDPNVINFNFANTPRSNRNPINNFMQVKEDPTTPGLYYGVDGFQSGTHGGGQIVSLTIAPTLDPDQTAVTYITDRSTAGITFEGNTPNPNHSGFYRTPIVVAGAGVIASHSPDSHADLNQGTRSNPVSRYSYRLKTLKRSGNVWVSDQTLTTGLSKTLTYWDPDTLVHFSGALWELDPVEVRVRQRPTRRAWSLPTQEQTVFTEEGISETAFRGYLMEKNLAVAVSRDVTHRDGADRQQPFYLRIAGTTKQSANASGKIYDVSDLQFYQGDYIRGHGLTAPNGTPAPGRRILAVPMHLPAGTNTSGNGAPAGSVKLGNDGSMAAFVPARRAMSWQLTSPTGTPIVRERYWVTFQPGEIRVCASCHGTNDAAIAPLNPVPQNKPQAFRDLLRTWKAAVFPLHVSLSSPANDTAGMDLAGMVNWLADARSTSYHVQVSTTSDFAAVLLDRDSVNVVSQAFSGLDHNATYYWRVQGINKYGRGDWSDIWRFTTSVAAPLLKLPDNGAASQPLSNLLTWRLVPGADLYRVQVATTQDFSTTFVDQTGLTDTVTNVAGLLPKQTYYWRVAATGHGAPGAWSDVWSFTTGEAPGMLAPLLASPPTGATSLPVIARLVWKPVAGADSFHLRVALGQDFAAPVLDRNGIRDTAFDIAGLEKGKKYYWHVSATGAVGTSPWSETWNFSTESAPVILAPVLALPGNGATAVPAAATLHWLAVNGADSYHVQLSDSDGFTTTIVDRTGVLDTMLHVTGLAYSRRYFWRVNASGAAGLSPWSQIWNFTTEQTPLSVDAETGASFTLEQNRPDPFNEATTLTFGTPRAGMVALKLYDMRGVEVATLADERAEAGTHALEIDSHAPGLAGLPSGVYLVRLVTEYGTRAVLVHLMR